jgi:hypothetical protein
MRTWEEVMPSGRDSEARVSPGVMRPMPSESEHGPVVKGRGGRANPPAKDVRPPLALAPLRGFYHVGLA